MAVGVTKGGPMSTSTNPTTLSWTLPGLILLTSNKGMEKGILIEEGGGFENDAMMEENGCLSLRSETKVVVLRMRQ